MKTEELEILIAKGEDSKTQFKENLTNARQLTHEFVAFSNCMGGTIIVGVTDNGEVKGLSKNDLQRINQLISNVSSENTKPPIYPETEVIQFQNKNILVVYIPYGVHKPYCTNEGIFLTRSGADKRKISQGELQRLFQESGKLYADEIRYPKAGFKDIDLKLFENFYKKKYKENFQHDNILRIFENLNLASDGALNLSGILLFSTNPMKYYPLSQLIAVSFLGDSITGNQYRDSENIEGNIKKLFEDGLVFLTRNLKKIQQGQNFNSTGILEIPQPVLEELLVNALIHRDYFINSNIRILIFDNRIEIISPGVLPNNLTVENIKKGVSVRRNQTLSSFAFDIIPYRGIGSGILRSLQLYPHIDFENDVETGQFKAIIARPGAW